MKKIFFDDKYGLTQAVLDGRKTMTRRIVPQSVVDYYVFEAEDPTMIDAARYEPGEVVAIAQAYRAADVWDSDPIFFDGMRKEAGWNNKLFVCSEYMPHHIKITDIKVERLQDISDEDCLKEGIYHCETCYESIHLKIEGKYHFKDCDYCFKTPRAAFAALIDKVSGKGTWEKNPWVFAYEFELID